MHRKMLGCLAMLLLITVLAGCVTYFSLDAPDRLNIVERTIWSFTQSEWRGRLTGTPGNAAAAVFLEDAFAYVGLLPLKGDDFRWEYQQLTFDPDVADPVIRLEFYDATTRELVFGRDFPLNVARRGVNIAMPITFDPDDPYINERFFITQERTPQLPPHAIFPLPHTTHSAPIINGLGMFQRYLPDTQPLHIGLLDEVFADIPWEYVVLLSFDINDSAEEQVLYNVAGFVPGADGSRAVIIGAHFDSKGYMGEIYTPGALDNAAGVAAMLRTAQIIAAWDDPPATDVVFVGFNGEENGLWGSRAFAQDILDLGVYNEIIYINIDSVGLSGAPFALDLTFDFDTGGRTLELAGGMAALMREWGVAYVDGIIVSDHTAFLERGIPAITLSHSGAHILPIIHTAGDGRDVLDHGVLEMVARLVAEFVYRAPVGFIAPVDSIAFEPEPEPESERSAFTGDFDEIAAAVGRHLKEVDLAIYEKYSFQMDDYIITFGFHGHFSYDEFRSQFPDIHIRRELRGYTLESISVGSRPGFYSIMYILWAEDEHYPQVPLNEPRRIDPSVDLWWLSFYLNYVSTEYPYAAVEILVRNVTFPGRADSLIGFGYRRMDADATGSPNYFITGHDRFTVVYIGDGINVDLLSIYGMSEVWEWLSYLDIHNNLDYYRGFFAVF